ncbi:MAG: VCBS repeat-containing protein [Pirellulales bacterium]|nr:VCBS repeat-containing protein [Pirellulales bacterium]
MASNQRNGAACLHNDRRWASSGPPVRSGTPGACYQRAFWGLAADYSIQLKGRQSMRLSNGGTAVIWAGWVFLCLLGTGCGDTDSAKTADPDGSGAPAATASTDHAPSLNGVELKELPDGSFAPTTVIPVSVSSAKATQADRLASKREAHADDWKSEVANADVAAQLKELKKLIEAVSQGKPLQSQGLVSAGFVGTSLRPQQLDMTKLAEGIGVRTASAAGGEVAQEYRGLDGFAEQISDLITPLLPCEVRHIKFKLVRIDSVEDVVSTRMIYQASFQGEGRTIQQAAQWTCRWQRSDELNPPLRLSELHATDYEEAECTNPSGSLFTDCTNSVLGANPSYPRQTLPGIPHWSSRITRQFVSHFGHHGIALGDVNGDGLDDLYACDTGGLPNRLYLQNPDGTATDASATAGVDIMEDSLGALLLDLDNDGDQDLVVATDPNILIYENDGTGVFVQKQSHVANSDAYSLCAADFDQDRDLDVYVCGYNALRPDAMGGGLPFPLPYDDANNGGRNLLLRNEGSLTFTDATDETGLDADNRRFSLAASWEDFDNDGDLDLYVANDFGRNCLYRNDKGKFTNIAAAAGVEDQASGMSVSWGDFDRDGWMDVYVSNMFSAAGNRITYQSQFSEGLQEGTVRSLRRMARGNTLFRNQGDGTFRDISLAAGVTLGRWAWASRFADLNNDGWQDLVVANGYVTNEDSDDL